MRVIPASVETISLDFPGERYLNISPNGIDRINNAAYITSSAAIVQSVEC